MTTDVRLASILRRTPRLHPRDRQGRQRQRQARRPCGHALSARAERLSAHRPRQVDLPQLRRRARLRRHLQPAVRRHEPGRRRTSEYVDSIQEDVRWLGFEWDDRLYYASDYFEKLYECAEILIERGLAYVDDLTPDEIREYRGTLTEPGRNSPYRDRSAAENLDLFRRMRAGEFPDGSHVLRAKIDMASPNINMRDPILYRIRRAHHHRTGDAWCIYPMYDYAHPISDAIERITHSHLHARVRGPPAALRLARRQPAAAGQAAADRVRAAEPELHDHEQAQAAAAREREARQRLGRPAHADDLRHPAARLHAGGDPALLRTRSASPSARTSSTSACSSTSCARI